VNKIEAQWWKKDEKSIPETLFGIVRFIQKNQNAQAADNLDFMRLYSNKDILGLNSDAYTRVTRKDRLTLNLVQSVVDTLQAKIAKNRPRPMFLTDDGSWAERSKAKKLQKFSDGLFYQVGFYEIAPKVFKDACVFGTGILKWYEIDGQIGCDRVFPNELSVDDADGMNGNPRTLYQTKTVSREVLLDTWPEYKNEIAKAQKADTQQFAGSLTLADQVTIVEAWHLSSGPDAKDGMHVISLDNQVLLKEEWKKDRFPFAFLRYNDRLLGFWGQGIAEQLMGIQIEINKLLRTLQLSMHLCSIPVYWIENGSKVAIQQMNNEIGRIGKYTGVKPTMEVQSGAPPDIVMQIDKLFQRGFEIGGISQLSATSQKPAGLNSGKALREYNDIETERFVITGQKYEQFALDSTELAIDLAADIYAREKTLKVKALSSSGFEEIDWKEIKLDRNDFVLQIFPTSFLSKTPAGRFQDVQELVQTGWVSKEQGMKLLDFPDLQNIMNLVNAPYDDVEETIGRMIDRGEYRPPEPYQNLELALRLTQLHYNKAARDGVPESRLELLRRYMDAIGETMKSAAPPPELPAGTNPLAIPAKPPVSDMLPLRTVQGAAPGLPMG
jgi:hypothetical protein